MASVKIQKLTLQRLKPFSSTLKPPEASAEAPEEPVPAVPDPTADAEQFVQHAEANGCEALLHAASLGIHGRILSKLLQQVS
jgi:lysyl-tRNA synthetase class I